MKRRWGLLVGTALAAGLVSCAGSPGAAPSPSVTAPEQGASGYVLRSTAFADGEAIPVRYTCDKDNVSPPLAWSGAPAGVQTFALIVDDPDAPRGTFTHWVLFNVPGTAQALAEGMAKSERLADGSLQGKNDGNSLGYTGPCPPAGNPHHYRFTLYALDRALTLPAGSSKAQVIEATQGHVMGEARLVGTYQRGAR